MSFKIANLKDDFKIVLQAKKDSENILNSYFNNTLTDSNIIKEILKTVENID